MAFQQAHDVNLFGYCSIHRDIGSFLGRGKRSGTRLCVELSSLFCVHPVFV